MFEYRPTNYTGQRFNRDQLVFVVEMMLVAALDRVESGMPTCITWADRLDSVNGVDRYPGKLTAWDRSALETVGMALGCFYAQLADDGLGIYDALYCAGNFFGAVGQWVELAWMDEGRGVFTRLEQLREARPNGYQIGEVYVNYPDCRRHAEAFVNEVFKDYLAVVG